MKKYYRSFIRPATGSRRTSFVPPILFSFILIINSFSQSVENKFIDALIYDRDDISEYIDKSELERSSRLGIEYTDAKHKFLISFDIPDEIKVGFRTGNYNYSLQTLQLEDGFSVITLAVPSSSYIQKFYFLNDKFIAPSRYFSRDWQVRQSRYFNFRISEPKYFNDYCIKRLDDFVDMVADTLGFSGDERRLLEEVKIDYILCADETEVEKVTGYRSKGQAVLAYDEIVTAYQTHFHEVAHLLINYRLKSLSLYTLPFFMEGFAAAMGGRGGMAPGVISDIGYFLQQSGFMSYDSILTYDEFYGQDATITYALSGLYNTFLVSYLGQGEYLTLYKKLNGNIDYVKGIKPGDITLPAPGKFVSYLEKYGKEKIFYVNPGDTVKPDIKITGTGGSFTAAEKYYKFFVVNYLLTGPVQADPAFEVYSKYLAALNGNGMTRTKYCITADSLSVKVINLFNDELIFNFNRNFSLTGIKIPSSGDYPYSFFIRKDIFENDLDGEVITGEGSR